MSAARFFSEKFNFLQSLKKSSCDFVRAKLNVDWTVKPSSLYLEIKNGDHTTMPINNTLRQLGSDVKEDTNVWRFKDADLNVKLTQLFDLVANNKSALGFEVKLSEFDLFHGHLFAVKNENGEIKDVGIIFHAKEFPRDLKLNNAKATAESPFTTESNEYAYRNFIWLASQKTIYNLDSNSTTIFPKYFLPDALSTNNDAMKDIVDCYLRAKTFFVENLGNDIELLGDINYFVNDEQTLFLTYRKDIPEIRNKDQDHKEFSRFNLCI